MKHFRISYSLCLFLFCVVVSSGESSGTSGSTDSGFISTLKNLFPILGVRFLYFRNGESKPKNKERHKKTPVIRSRRKSSRQTPSNGNVLTMITGGTPSDGYYCSFRFGARKEEFSLMLDTGSSNTGIASYPDNNIDSYYSSTNYTDHHVSVSVSYTAGGWEGFRIEDTLTVKLNGQDFSLPVIFDLITKAQPGFFPRYSSWQGIWGMAYSSLAQPQGSLTFWEQLKKSLKLQDEFSLGICPPLDNANTGNVLNEQLGHLDLGGSKPLERAKGPKFETLLHQTNPQYYYTVAITDMRVGNKSLGVDCTEYNKGSTILDSGTTDIFLSEVVFNEMKVLFLEVLNRVSQSPYNDEFLEGSKKLAFNRYNLKFLFSELPDIKIAFAHSNDSSKSFYLIIPPQLYLRQSIGTEADKQDAPCFTDCNFYYFGVKKREKGTVIGAIALMGFYVNIDRAHNTIGFWESQCEYTSNDDSSRPRIIGSFSRDASKECAVEDSTDSEVIWNILTYVLPTVSFVLLLLSMQFIHSASWAKRNSQATCCKSVRRWFVESFCCGALRLAYIGCKRIVQIIHIKYKYRRPDGSRLLQHDSEEGRESENIDHHSDEEEEKEGCVSAVRDEGYGSLHASQEVSEEEALKANTRRLSTKSLSAKAKDDGVKRKHSTLLDTTYVLRESKRGRNTVNDDGKDYPVSDSLENDNRLSDATCPDSNLGENVYLGGHLSHSDFETVQSAQQVEPLQTSDPDPQKDIMVIATDQGRTYQQLITGNLPIPAMSTQKPIFRVLKVPYKESASSIKPTADNSDV